MLTLITHNEGHSNQILFLLLHLIFFVFLLFAFCDPGVYEVTSKLYRIASLDVNLYRNLSAFDAVNHRLFLDLISLTLLRMSLIENAFIVEFQPF